MTTVLLMECFLTSEDIFRLQKTPVEFFGVPLDDTDLTDAPMMDILGACRGVLVEIKREEIYENYKGSTDKAAVTGFFTALARLAPEEQQKCFDAIVNRLKTMPGKEGMEHIVNRLLNGKCRYLVWPSKYDEKKREK